MMRRVWILMLLFPLGCGGSERVSGLHAYQQGRFSESLEAFTAAEKASGHEAPAELLYNRALAALRAGQLRIAEFSAEKAAARGGMVFVALRDFLLGSTAFARCLRAEAEGSLMDADPTAFDRAIAHAEAAGRSWRTAASGRDDWPEARRNAERALRKLKELRMKRAAAEKRPKKTADPDAQPQPRPVDRDPPDLEESAQSPQRESGRLSPEQMTALLGKLAEKEREKLSLRRARQKLQRAKVEKDW